MKVAVLLHLHMELFDITIKLHWYDVLFLFEEQPPEQVKKIIVYLGGIRVAHWEGVSSNYSF